MENVCYKSVMIKAIFLDMDDTLIVNQVLFENATFLLCGYLRHFGVLQAEAEEVFSRIDKENFKTHGYSRTRLPSSFEQTLRHFVPNADEEMVSIARGFAEDVFTANAPLKPGVDEAVKILSQRYRLYIVTAGDESVQSHRYANNIPFQDKIGKVFIVPKKDKCVYETVLAELGLKPDEAVMIGDSLKSDVIPATEAGMQAVWVEAHNSQHESAAGFPPSRAYKASSLIEAAERLVRRGTPAPRIGRAFPKPRRTR